MFVAKTPKLLTPPTTRHDHPAPTLGGEDERPTAFEKEFALWADVVLDIISAPLIALAVIEIGVGAALVVNVVWVVLFGPVLWLVGPNIGVMLAELAVLFALGVGYALRHPTANIPGDAEGRGPGERREHFFRLLGEGVDARTAGTASS